MASELNVGGITTTGNVGVGASPDDHRLVVRETTSDEKVLELSSANGSCKIDFSRDGDPTAFIKMFEDGASGTGALYFGTGTGASPATKLTIASTGLATFSNGIAFQSATTGNGTSGEAFTLDKYETGLFTPVVADAGTGGNAASAGAANGRYTKVGNRVYCQVSIINITTTGLTAVNIVYVRGLPFTSISTVNFYSPVEVFQGAMTSTEGVIHGLVYPNTDYMTLQNSISGAAGSTSAIVSQITSGSGDMYMSFQYETAL